MRTICWACKSSLVPMKSPMMSKLKNVSDEPAAVFITLALAAETQCMLQPLLCWVCSTHALPLKVLSWAVVSPNMMQSRYGISRSKTKISSIM